MKSISLPNINIQYNQQKKNWLSIHNSTEDWSHMLYDMWRCDQFPGYEATEARAASTCVEQRHHPLAAQPVSKQTTDNWSHYAAGVWFFFFSLITWNCETLQAKNSKVCFSAADASLLQHMQHTATLGRVHTVQSHTSKTFQFEEKASLVKWTTLPGITWAIQVLAPHTLTYS